ncbi:ATPase, partial [Candidatus Poribacteria bacterium]|nr:ATPase [Candidatus Poribacteria bacterium]
MARIEGIRIRNFRSLKDVTLGKLWNTQGVEPLTPITAVIGKNGVGKSALFDVFGFLADCLKVGVEEACDARGRGGFERIRTQGQTGPIGFEIYYREETISRRIAYDRIQGESGSTVVDVNLSEKPSSRPITYELSIDLDPSGRPYVKKERFRQRRARQSHGRPYSFLILDEGTGVVWKGLYAGAKLGDEDDSSAPWFLVQGKGAEGGGFEESAESETVELEDVRKLGIATLGALRQHPRIASFRRFIEDWYLSYFVPDAARGLPLSGPQKRLNAHGDNLANVVQYMEREHKDR